MAQAKSMFVSTTNLVCLGLNEKDIQIVKSIIKMNPNLRNEIVLLESSQIKDADVLLINVDDFEAINSYWASCTESLVHNRGSKQQSVPIFVHSGKFINKNDDMVLQFPIRRRTLDGYLTKVVSVEKKLDPVLVDKTRQKVNRILVVDDSFPVRKYMQSKLHQVAESIVSGPILDVDIATSGRDAVEKIKSAKGDYSIIFLDVMMDDINGYKICKWIKSVSKKIKVIMLTSKDSRFDKVRGTMSGCDRYLTKPPKEEDLQDILSNL